MRRRRHRRALTFQVRDRRWRRVAYALPRPVLRWLVRRGQRAWHLPADAYLIEVAVWGFDQAYPLTAWAALRLALWVVDRTPGTDIITVRIDRASGLLGDPPA